MLCSIQDWSAWSAPAAVEHEVVDDGDEVAGEEHSRGARDNHNIG